MSDNKPDWDPIKYDGVSMSAHFDNLMELNYLIKNQKDMSIKPPLGLTPRKFHDEARYVEVCGAISRYYNANMPIPLEWVEEFNHLVLHVNKNPGNLITKTDSFFDAENLMDRIEALRMFKKKEEDEK